MVQTVTRDRSLALTMASKPVLWLRCEKKEFERRAALTPTTSKALIDAGFEIIVERDAQRIFDDAEYEKYTRSIYTSTLVHIIFLALDANSSKIIPGLQLPKIPQSLV